MKETIEVLNRMQADGIIGLYAIGGAVGATFYLEPVATMDIDVFVSFQQSADSPLISLSPMFDYLKKMGCETRGEYVVIGGWPVQFLPPADAWRRRVGSGVEQRSKGCQPRDMPHLLPRCGRSRQGSRRTKIWNQACWMPEADAILTRYGL